MSAFTIGIVGGTARAAAGAARRAGWQAWAIDPFGDRDLKRIAETRLCPFDHYPRAIPELAGSFPAGPFLYTGGLENHPEIVAKLMETRSLLGNPPAVLAKVRDPFWLHDTLLANGFPSPRVLPGNAPVPTGSRWLRKSPASAGGLGVRFAGEGEDGYLQEFLEGRSVSAVFADAVLLGMTEQLIGESWLHAGGFQYCGTVGPLLPGESLQAVVRRLGCCLHETAALRGIWGADGILKSERFWPIEVNPRYTASVEVLELAANRSAFADPAEFVARRCVGKAILFAPQTLTFPEIGPWDRDLESEFDPWRVPGYADIPAPGEVIESGRPVMTFFAEAATIEECRTRLRERAKELFSRLRVRAEPDHHA